ncbi:FtsX-like permease family protein [Lysinibacillus xylanilyticus]|uniref:FtsX-like permease family protein n=1 Tax=Lysinibacillus xylanilyticus TaxID=582475 RepID=UPI002B241EA4|nr:FtsX-like permease family protein [Lysinibacillus xylanilyticus]MEB2301703.1 FtsX-like permease family protein [Lysinibacillus xylanilyticus]
MYAIITLCFAHIKKRKVQNVLLAVLIMLSTLLLATSVTIIMNTNNIFEKTHHDSNGAHQILTMGKDIHNPITVNNWWQEQQGVTASNLIPYRNLSGFTANSVEMQNPLFMMNTPKMPFAIDRLLFSEGENQDYPTEGTIWIPTSMASTSNISLGDAIEFNTGEKAFTLSVSGIVVDLPYGGPFTNTARIWMNESDYLKQFDTLIGSEQYMMALRFDDYQQSANYWIEFEKFLKGPYLESKMEYEQIASFYLIINKIIGFLMIAFGVAMLFISLFIIGFSISDAILTNYKTIGVIKSLGLTSRKISATYVLQFLLLSVVSIIPGLIASTILSRVIIESSLSYLKAGKHLTIIQDFRITMLLAGIILVIVILTAFIYSNKARHVEPVQAIKYGMSEFANSKLNRRLNNSNRLSNLIQLPIQLQIGIKNITKNMKSSILIIVLTAITSAILVFSAVMLNSFISIKQNTSAMGYDSSHVVVTVNNEATFSKQQFEQFLRSDERIKNHAWLDQFTGVFPNEPNQPLNINVDTIEGSFDDAGYETISGRNPVYKNEIAIGINVAKALHKNLGDIVEVYIEGKQHHLIVTGIYQSIANMSYSSRITADVIKVYNATYSASKQSMINLVDETLSAQIVDDLNNNFKSSVSADTQQSLLDNVFKVVVAVFIFPLSVIVILFIAVTFIIIFSVSRINVRKESGTYGIFKSIGMTSNTIRWSVTSGILFLSALGTIFGIFIGVKVIPVALQSIIVDYGLLELPLVINWPITIGLSLLSVVVACLGCWVSTKIIAKTSPRILLVD